MNFLRPFALCLTSSLALWSQAAAAPINANQAQDAARLWMQARSTAALEPASVVAWPSSVAPAVYLVHMLPQGFVLVSADDGLRPVLGWSDRGQPSDTMPPALVDRLTEVETELVALQSFWQNSAPPLAEWDEVLNGIAPAQRDLGVLPLLSCNWDQGAGWNQFCPVDGAGPGGRVYAGCVATSMVQVMHYWQQPWHGTGSHGYQSDYGWLQADFGAATYDWNAMLPNAPTADAALVMYHAGIAVDMMYAPDGSGAYVGFGNPNALTAMRDNFGFLPSLQFIRKSNFTWDSWRTRLQQELDAGRPILHSGYGSGGHAFNIDGWREDSYFHLNWGWSGAFNGWFLIDALNPGGSDFSQDQGAVVNLVPAQFQAPPALEHPLNNSLDVECAPVTFQWADAPGATSYELMIDEGTDFISPVLTLSGLTETSLAVEDLNYYSQYYWRIRSHNEQGTGPWSATAGFFTSYWNQTPPPMPATPMNGAVNVNVNPTVLVWNFVEGATSYRVQVGADAAFTSLVADTSAVLTHYVLLRNVLEEGTQYWWRVQCEGLAGTSEWSTVRSLTTLGGTALDEGAQTAGFQLAAPWPNPFNPSTHLAFVLEHAGPVTLEVRNLAGQRVALLLEQAQLSAGSHELDWHAGSLPSGIYLVELQTGSQRAVQKVSLLR